MIFSTELEKIPGFESVHRFECKSIDAVTFIARHSRALGPPLGGCRVRDDYECEAEALTDALRLAEGMTYKAAIHNLPLGGGKMVVWCQRPLIEIDREKLFAFVGRAVDTLKGGYITAEDLNTTVDDMRIVRRETSHVAGIDSGDPSEFTALGVWEVMRYLANQHLGKDIRQCKLAVQGVGKVGTFLLDLALSNGIKKIYISDSINERVKLAVEKFGCVAVDKDKIYSLVCDFFVPCAHGGILNSESIPRLRCSVVAGAANNQLENPDRDEGLLRRKGILYCPDVIVNGGGLINVSCEFPKYDRAKSEQLVRRIPETLREVLDYAAGHRISDSEAVIALTKLRIEAASIPIGRFRTGH